MSARSSWCNTHRGPTERAIAVAVIEVNSGPGGTVWSCPDCVARYGIVPLDEQSPDHPASRIQYRTARPPRAAAVGAGGAGGSGAGAVGAGGADGADAVDGAVAVDGAGGAPRRPGG